MNAFDRKMVKLVVGLFGMLVIFAVAGCDQKQVQVAKAACQFSALTNEVYNIQTQAPVAIGKVNELCATVNSIPIASAPVGPVVQ